MHTLERFLIGFVFTTNLTLKQVIISIIMCTTHIISRNNFLQQELDGVIHFQKGEIVEA